MASWLDPLLYAAILVAVWSLLKMRIGLFFIAINQAIVLRAFSGIVLYGQPKTQAFLPGALFAPSAVETAIGIFAISVPLTALFAVLPYRGAQASEPAVLPAIPRWVLAVMGLYFVVYAVSLRTIFTTQYAGQGQIIFDAPSGGLQGFATGAFIYELYRRVRVGSLTPLRASGYLFGLLFITDYSKGGTGLATSYLLAGVALFFSTRTGLRHRLLPVGAVLIAVTLTAMFIRTARTTLHQGGTSTLVEAAESIQTAESRRAETGEGLEDRMNGPQLAAHTLECVWLYDTGRSREWRSYYLPFIYTFQPSFLLKPLGITRPKEAAWELGDYFIHGGGIFCWGEMYWNGGYFCVFVVTLAMVALAWLVDTRRDRSLWLVLFACMFTPTLLQGTQYGITYPMRGLANSILAAILFIPAYLAARKRQNQAKPPLLGRLASDDLAS